MGSFVVRQYYDSLRQLKRGNYKGIVSNAKPYLLLSIINALENNEIKDNKIYLTDILPYYLKFSKQFSPQIKPSPISYPFYHLKTESFYHLNWKEMEMKNDAPSTKWVKDNIKYSSLDNALWNLLQNKDIRDDYKKSIEEYYLK